MINFSKFSRKGLSWKRTKICPLKWSFSMPSFTMMSKTKVSVTKLLLRKCWREDFQWTCSGTMSLMKSMGLFVRHLGLMRVGLVTKNSWTIFMGQLNFQKTPLYKILWRLEVELNALTELKLNFKKTLIFNQRWRNWSKMEGLRIWQYFLDSITTLSNKTHLTKVSWIRV